VETPGSVTSTVRRAGAFALVGALSLVVPVLAREVPRPVATVGAAAPFLFVAAAGLYVVEDGVFFELFARPGDRRDGRLYGLAGFALSIAGLSLLATYLGMPVEVFVATVLLLSTGNLGGHLVRARGCDAVVATAGFVVAGVAAGFVGFLASAAVLDVATSLPLVVFLVTTGALAGALLRTVLFERDDPLVLLSVGLLLWLFADLSIAVSTRRIAVALGVMVLLGYLSYALETASLPGMLTGVLLGLLTIVVGDYGWFVVLVTFFGVGGLSSKLRYETKVQRGIAEPNDGARGSGNVLANSLVALFAVIAHAASPRLPAVPNEVFLFVFAGAVAAAMSDTLSSEIGGLFDRPRLITTLEVVEPGTDGGITWQGVLAGVAGAGLIAGLCALFFDVGLAGVALIVGAGVAGMLVDSVLGALIEDRFVGNQGVNFLATLAAGLAGGALAALVGLAP